METVVQMPEMICLLELAFVMNTTAKATDLEFCYDGT